MNTAEIILFPNMREPIVRVFQHWWQLGYVISNRRGRGYTLKRISQ